MLVGSVSIWRPSRSRGSSPTLRASSDGKKSVSKAESIRTFRILPTDFTIEGGELTPTLKVKRRVVADHFGSAIESIYTK